MPSAADTVAFKPGLAARDGRPNRFSVEVAQTLEAMTGDNRLAVAYREEPPAPRVVFGMPPGTGGFRPIFLEECCPTLKLGGGAGGVILEISKEWENP